MKYDYLIVGAGFFGSTFARKMANAGKRCLVVDKNPHVAGAAFDKLQEGIMVSQYGAHILHTHSEEIWNFLQQFSPIDTFINKPKVLCGKNVYSFPINMMTLHQLWGVVTPAEAREKINSVRIPCNNPRNFEEWVLDKVGTEIYEKFIYGYTKKQWLKEPKDLPSSIIARLPIRLTYEENYFTTKYQGIPRYGYNKLVENMLEGIDVELGVNFFDKLHNDWKGVAKHLVYTGPVDKFYNYKFGELEYNTLRFEHKVFKGDFQGNAVFNYTDMDVPYIRTIEHKHFYDNNTLKHYTTDKNIDLPTVVSYDYPISYKENPEPYYPIRDEYNSALYAKYIDIKKNDKDVTFGGRLGEYKYLDIDQTVASAYAKAERLLSG